MAQNVIKRRDEAVMRKQNGSSAFSTVSTVAAAVVMALVILLGSAFGSVFKKPVDAPEQGSASSGPAADSQTDASTEAERTVTDTEVPPDEAAETATESTGEKDTEAPPDEAAVTATESTAAKDTDSHAVTAAETYVPRRADPNIVEGIELAIDLYEKDKHDPLILTKEEYGRHNWLSRETIKNYRIDLPTDMPDDYDHSEDDRSYYGYATPENGIRELELKLKSAEGWVGTQYLVRIEADEGVEILSDIMFRGELTAFKDNKWSTPGDYISIPIRFRITNDKKMVDFRVYLFYRTTTVNDKHGIVDHLTEAEEYFAKGYSIADKAYPNWKEVMELEKEGKIAFNSLLTFASCPYEFRFVEIKGYDFLQDWTYFSSTVSLFERAALYFGDVDDNGVPLVYTNSNLPDYPDDHARLPMLKDVPGYEEILDRIAGRDAECIP